MYMCEERRRRIEKVRQLRDALYVLEGFTNIPFYPTAECDNFTEMITEFSSRECCKFNEIIEKFQSRIKEWDFR